MKRFLFPLIVGSVLVAGCGNKVEKPAATEPQTQQQVPANKPQKPEKPVMLERDNMDEKLEKKMKEVVAEKDNITSPYRYLISSEIYSSFGQLVKASTLTKHMHSAGVTVLAPTNNAMSSFDKWKKWLADGDTDRIDDFVAYHIINSKYSRKEMEIQTSVLNHAGKVLAVEGGEGACRVEGSPVNEEYVETRNGIVLQLDQLFYRP